MADDAPYGVSRVADWLLLGGHIPGPEHIGWLREQGVTHVICAACELSDRRLCDEHDLRYYHLYWHDDRQPKSAGELCYLLTWLSGEQAALVESGKPMRLYVHCAAGYNRGPLVATFLLAARCGLSAGQAWERVKASRPGVTAFEQAVYRESCETALAEFAQSIQPPEPE
ncbi:MAG TPA: dual specificity protein phosphatase [Ktedonobacterales bacterium]